jgi:hypothetical protein
MKSSEGLFYLKATFVCSDCNFEKDVLINKDKEVYHECNQGNVENKVPEFVLPVHQPKKIEIKLLEEGIK